MATNTRQLRIFIAFTSDCSTERDAIRQLCQTDLTVKHICRALNISLDICDFGEVCPDAGRPQSVINAAADKLQPDWYIFLFWQRLGTDAGLGMTGMEEEWNRALQLNHKGGGRPWVSAYFNQADPARYDASSEQLELLARFKKRIREKYEALTTDFKGTENLRERFRGDLSFRLHEFYGVAHSLDLKRQFLEASKGLLEWPRTVKGSNEIDRPELHTLMEKFRASESSTTLILGRAGSGKSALLARLGNECLKEGVPVLAIKADRLGKAIRNSEDLRQWLHLSLETNDAIRKLAEKESVIVLIDQLDAVSELLDRHSERLNVLLDLILRLSHRSGVHIVASSREFEYRHDVRLNSINADRLELTLPIWDQISPILKDAGYQPAVMAEPTKELLRSPWNLKVFLDIARPGMEFPSLQYLFEEVWNQQVLDGEGAQGRISLLERLANKMAKDETLWLPTSQTDKWPDTRQALEQREILTRGPDGKTIGFRHQTYYDYTIARAFASGSMSLSDYVSSKQDGLFVRPSLLSGLHYLRGTSQTEYHRQITRLLRRRFRPHIRSLVVEFLGEQNKPDDTEADLLCALLSSEKEGPHTLAAVAGSPGWFQRLSNERVFLRWLQKPHEKALHCLNVLCLATQFMPDKVLDLLENYWLPKRNNDDLTLRVFSYLPKWDDRAVNLACPLLRRHRDSGASLLMDRAAENSPDLAPVLLRADLDRRVQRARSIMAKLKRGNRLSTEEKREAGPSFEGPRGPLIRLIESEEDWYGLDAIAEGAPKAFLDHIWSWFVDVISEIANEEHEIVLTYRDDPATCHGFDGELPQGPITKAILLAVVYLAQDAPDSFLLFAQRNVRSDLLIVHRLLARGLVHLAEREPKAVLGYVLGDPRRLSIGDYSDCHAETKALIMAVCRHLQVEDLKTLENHVIEFQRYKNPLPDRSPQERFDRMKWNREHRLRILRSFPVECLSERGRSLREQEERALPRTADHDSQFHVGWVGPRMTAAQMEKASNSDLLRLFTELPDHTEGSNPRRQWPEDYSRAGGASQQSRELGELAKKQPHQVIELMNEFRAGEQETYAGAALEGLAQTEVPTSDLVAIVQRLDEKGFSSGSFREGASNALKMRAGKDNGLSQDVLTLLEKWLAIHSEPDLNVKRETRRKEEDVDKGREILFGHSPIWIYPHGRGPIIEAIAEGYLKQDPPNFSGWAQVVLSRIGTEHHPAIWVVTLMRMPSLFNWNKVQATQLFDLIIRNYPSVLYYDFALYPIAHIVRLCEPKEASRGWIDMLRRDASKFAQQAYGEFLFIYHCCYGDSWSHDRITRILSARKQPRVLLGLAHGASHLWKHGNCRAHATKVLRVLATSKNPLIVNAMVNVFRLNRDEFDFGPEMRQIVFRVSRNRSALIAAAEDLLEITAPHTAAEPELVLQICRSLVKLNPETIRRFGISSIAENLTNVSLTLHRQPRFRAAGLQLFESLLAMNLREALAALEILDRKPVQKIAPNLPRRRRRRRAIPARP